MGYKLQRREVRAVLERIDQALSRSRKLVEDTHPTIEQLLRHPVRYYAQAWVKAAGVIGSIRYDAPLNQMRRYYVDPQRIDRTVTWTIISTDKKANEHPRFRPPKYRLSGRVFKGDWDTVDDRVTDSTIYQSFVNHFEDGVPWDETEFYQDTLNAIGNGASLWDCSSESDLKERCLQLERLYEDIATEGYKTQGELYRVGNPTANSHRLYRVIWDEIGIHVGRNGEFIFHDGRNRLAIARILGLEEIPVVILVRHKQWQRKRDRLASGELDLAELPESLRTHPDLTTLF